ncbi:MAG: hypothetical protein IPL26_18815 [Leptospiraceae bacterium]|nr:hypothetical protein [Leptospiraceae bacterium]
MEPESKLKKILFWNLGIYFTISLLEILAVKLLSTEGDGNYLGVFYMIFSAMSFILQIGINFILAAYYFIKDIKDLGKSFLVSAFVILLIGFPLCFGGLLLGI